MSSRTITVNELQHKLSSRPDLPVIDVRTPLEYSEVHVPKAKLTPLDKLDPKSLVQGGTVPAQEDFYILCRSGKRATTAAEQFAGAGFSNGVVVEGGTLAWVDAGYPVERSGKKVISLERQVRIAAGSLVLTGAVLGWLVHPGFFGLSAFVG